MSSTENSFRIDKYLAATIGQVTRRLDADDETLIRNIIYYVAESYEKSLFGFGTIDPWQFAKAWGYDRSNLQRIHPEPYQLSLMRDNEVAEYRARLSAGPLKRRTPDTFVWDTLLENALFILANKTMSFNRYQVYEDAFGDDGQPVRRGVVTKENIAFTLFTKIEARCVGVNRYVYTYTLNPNFEQNLTKYYVRGEKNSLIMLRPRRRDALYLFLTNLKASMGVKGERRTVPGNPSFEYLCDLAGIPRETQDGKEYETRKLKLRLKEALEDIRNTTELSFSVEWVRSEGSPYAYCPVIDFGENAVPSERYLENVRYHENRKIYRQLIGLNLRDMYSRLFVYGSYSDIDADRFNAWLFNKNLSKLEKDLALNLAFIKIFGAIPADAGRRKAEIMEHIDMLSRSEASPTIEMLLSRI